jgi:uncharacterized protein YdaU (DUF1376 family)
VNYYEHHIGDYAAATAHLSWDEDMAYTRLLRAYYHHEKGIPQGQEYRIARATTAAQRKAVDAVLREFFSLNDGAYSQKRADEEIERYRSKSAKARESALASVAARRDRSNAQIRSERMAAARAKGTHTTEQWIALRHVCGYVCVKCGASGHQDRDHITPVYQGGSDSIDNIQPLCARCNASKGPESVDYRPNGWLSLVERTLNERPPEFERTLSERSANVELPSLQTPDTRHQTPRKEPRKRATPLPDGFVISDRVRSWALAKGLNHLDQQLEAFLSYARRKGATYVDWDEALMNAIREDWAKARVKGQSDAFAGSI